jgi:photosystem II stability/assembly factor-like uncharacterized protein
VTSADGAIWVSRASGSSNALRDVAWSGSRFVAVGDAGAVVVSTDGSSWSALALNTTDILSSVAWNGTSFVVPSTGFVATAGVLRSADGLSWTSDTLGLAPPIRSLQVTSAGLLGVGESGMIFSSPDGKRWSHAPAAATTSDLYAIGSNGSTLVAVGARGTIVTSVDGVSWTARSGGYRDAVTAIDFDGRQYVATGVFGTVLTSADGSAWTFRGQFGEQRHLYGIAGSGRRWVAVGEKSTILSSDDGGVSWTPQTAARGDAFTDVLWDGNRFVAAGYGGTVQLSADGATWEAAGQAESTLYSLSFANGLYVAVGGDGSRTISTSTDARTWTLRSSRTGGTLTGAAWSGSRWVVVGDSGRVLSSTDGIAWQERAAATDKTLSSVAWSGSRFIAVGEDGIRFESVDGLAWNAAPSQTVNDLYRVRSFGGTLFAAGRYGTILKGACTAERAVTAPTNTIRSRRVRTENLRPID